MVASYEGVTDAVKAAEPALSTLAQTSLGALAVVSTAIAVLAVWKLSKTQEKAVERAETASKRMEGLITQMTTAFSTVDKTLSQVSTKQDQALDLLQDILQTLAGMKSSIDGVIRDAVLGRAYRSYTPSGGTQMPGKGDPRT